MSFSFSVILSIYIILDSNVSRLLSLTHRGARARLRAFNLVPRVSLSLLPLSLRRKTLVAAGHVAAKIWEPFKFILQRRGNSAFKYQYDKTYCVWEREEFAALCYLLLFIKLITH